MWLKQRVTAGLTAVLLAAGGLGYSTLTANAFNCGGWSNSQKDTYFQTSSYYLHHWLGYCLGGGAQIYYYAGNDSRYSWGGSLHTINKIDVHLRDWDCAGQLAYDFDVTVYNAASKQLTSTTTCMPGYGPQTDSNDQEYQPGVFNWWDYLHYPS
jgi:hypothetical protein